MKRLRASSAAAVAAAEAPGRELWAKNLCQRWCPSNHRFLKQLPMYARSGAVAAEMRLYLLSVLTILVLIDKEALYSNNRSCSEADVVHDCWLALHSRWFAVLTRVVLHTGLTCTEYLSFCEVMYLKWCEVGADVAFKFNVAADVRLSECSEHNHQ